MTEGSLDDTEQQSDGEKLVSGLRQLVDERTPDKEDWCPNCEKYAVFNILQTVERPKFGVENDVKGCPDCRHTTINQTEWRSVELDADGNGGDS